MRSVTNSILDEAQIEIYAVSPKQLMVQERILNAEARCYKDL
jgi:hypothetical protein